MRKITDISINTNTFVTCIILPETKYEVVVTFDDGVIETYKTLFFEGSTFTNLEIAVDFLRRWLKTDMTDFCHDGKRLILNMPGDAKSGLSLI